MIRRIAISLIAGFCITATQTFVSDLFVWLMPYRDLPFLPKPFFLFSLLPGVAAAELVDGPKWISLLTYVAASSTAYALVLGIIGLLWSRIRSQQHAQSKQISNGADS
jgi:hypothetical protein